MNEPRDSSELSELMGSLGLVPEATISSIQQELHVSIPVAKRLLALRDRLAARGEEPARELLRKLRGWDHLEGAADGPFWRREIDRVLTDGAGDTVPLEVGEEPAPPPTLDVAVAGRFDRTLFDFQRACLVHLGEEQRRANPDNALIVVLCDAVRLSREHAEALDAFSAVLPQAPRAEEQP